VLGRIAFYKFIFFRIFIFCHPRAGGDPEQRALSYLKGWIPACAGMTNSMPKLGGVCNRALSFMPNNLPKCSAEFVTALKCSCFVYCMNKWARLQITPSARSSELFERLDPRLRGDDKLRKIIFGLYLEFFGNLLQFLGAWRGLQIAPSARKFSSIYK